MASYRVQVWSPSTTDFSPSLLVAEFENPKNLGYASYLNDIGEAFFTINQRDAKANVRAQEGKGHVFIIRNDGTNEDVVWRGTLAEHDATQDDVVFYAYGYEHFLYTLYTWWGKKWQTKKIAGATGRPIDDMWARVKTIVNSPLQWVTTGTTEAPLVLSSGTTELVLNYYKVNWKRIHTAMKELTAIATSDTDNVVYMEIDYPADPTDHSATFNYWKDRTADVTDFRLDYPNGNVMGYHDRFTPILFRNKALAVGSGPRGQLYRYTKAQKSGTYGDRNFGKTMQNLYLTWVRDRKELKRITKRRLRLGLKENTDLAVRMYPGSIVPWRATASGHNLGDRVYASIAHGATRISDWLTIMGEQVVWAKGVEYVQPLVEDRSSSPQVFGLISYSGLADGTSVSLAGVPYVDNAVAPGSYVRNRTVTIADDATFAALCYVIVGDNTAGLVTATLGGVAGVVAGEEVSSGSTARMSGIIVWYGSDIPTDSSTATMSITYAAAVGPATAISYGLVIGPTDIDVPVTLTAAGANDSAPSNRSARVTVDSGANIGFAIGSVVQSDDSPSTQPADVKLATTGADQIGTAATGVHWSHNVFVETAVTSGSRYVGSFGNGGNAWAIQAIVISNED